MWKESILLVVAVIAGVASLWMTLTEWDESDYVHVQFGSFRGLAVLTLGLGSIGVGSLLAIGKCYDTSLRQTEEGMLYQGCVASLFAFSCYVWVTAVTNQVIVDACGNPLTIGAPVTINMTCVKRCDGTDVTEHHRLPFLTQDATFHHASKHCAPWFTEDTDTIRWIMTWETVLFTGLALHLFTRAVSALVEREKLGCSVLLVVDVVSCLSVACITIVPRGHYSAYNLGGICRFLGLLHVILPLQRRITEKHCIGFFVVLKLIFVTLTGAALMFVAEKPCMALQDECDSGFDDFGNTLYFIFVTLSTVGYGDMSPKTGMGKVAIAFIIMSSISYLPNIIAEVLELCRKNPIHDRLDDMHADIKQVGFHMNGGTLKRQRRNKLLNAIQRRNGEIKIQCPEV